MKNQLDLKPEQSLELLKELHILTQDGRINQDSRRKLKQVYHLYQFIEPILKNLQSTKPDFNVVDHGAGKSYLGFIFYDLFVKQLATGNIFCIETRKELNEKSTALARKLKFERMHFLDLSVQDSMTSEALPAEVDLVTALHACDTATDDAIAFGIRKKARSMVLVPCCQAEVAGFLRDVKKAALPKSVLTEMYRHPLHTREFGSHITNVLRCLQLQAHGYQVTVTELVGWEHSMKNELIIAEYKNLSPEYYRDRLVALLAELGLTQLQSRFFI